MTIGIMGAMPEEIHSIRSIMTKCTDHVIGNRTYTSGHINNTPVVLVFSRWGKVAASITTTTLIHTFSVNKIIFTGVAGAVSKRLAIGDIVVSQKVFQHVQLLLVGCCLSFQP